MSTKPQQPLPQQVNVDISQADDVKCDECGHDVFIPVFMIKKVRGIMSPNGQEMITPVRELVCNNWGQVK